MHLGENIKFGKYKNTILAKVWKRALDTGKIVLIDIESYEANNNMPAFFMGMPYVQGDKTLEVIAIQLRINQMNAIMQKIVGKIVHFLP